jgi:uncharacterized protein YbjT (DUF2867 family)
VARCLIVGCGCRGRSLARQLRGRGHAVRGTTRNPDSAHEIEAAGAEAFVGDPDRIATLTPALEHVSVVFILLGSASGPAERVAALHRTRLEMLLTRMLDTTVRGLVYESAGSVEAPILSGGVERVRAACEGSLIPYVLLDTDPSDHPRWVAAASGAADRVMGV